ncbi:DUF488 domain-containing protein [Geitlerinema sp. CS-897]|uniref:DUF488 domain-containing protein n=1 Tax=Baaleninema simplex TaxID=2862350 RepID=UPI00034D1BA7|nr:DUF488 domain-containing protein [Baaleninema simplex]MDC0832388.1 DUF488 domain-containing protein [Geitlerinema sp. CS-897]
MTFFTIGHSNHSFEKFVALLQQHQISALADVRSHPYSRYCPHFDRAFLKKNLPEFGIAYVFLGKELGARAENLSCYENGKALYSRIAKTESFSQGIDRLCKGSDCYQISLMCAEQDPLTCHRAILVSRHLKKRGFDIQHILKNGDLESQDYLEERLLEKHHLDRYIQDSSQPEEQATQLSLFGVEDNAIESNENSEEEALKSLDKSELIELAYQRQGDAIAYVDKTMKNLTLQESTRG